MQHDISYKNRTSLRRNTHNSSLLRIQEEILRDTKAHNQKLKSRIPAQLGKSTNKNIFDQQRFKIPAERIIEKIKLNLNLMERAIKEIFDEDDSDQSIHSQKKLQQVSLSKRMSSGSIEKRNSSRQIVNSMKKLSTRESINGRSTERLHTQIYRQQKKVGIPWK